MSSADTLAQRLNTALGAPVASAAPEARGPAAVGGMVPQVAVFPSSEEQVAALLGFANAERLAVVPWGSGSSRAGGAAPSRYDIALSLTGLGRILDHDGDNLTLTAQAGLALAEANRQTRPKHQFLPLGFAQERRTLGGLAATNRTPPQRLQYGDLRDQVLGLRVATAEGTLVRYGRKVLKNVAGYDMNKLFLGAEGLLGVIVELTVKLSALPDDTGYLLGAFADPPQAFAAANALFRSRLQPSGLFVLDAAAGSSLRAAQGMPPSPQATHLLAGFEGRGVTVKRQLADGTALMREHGATTAESAPTLSERATEVLERPTVSSGESALLRLGAAPTELPGVWSSVGMELDTRGQEAKVADYGAGQLRVAVGVTAPSNAVAAHIAHLREGLIAQRGYAVLQAAPPDLRAMVPAWGDAGGELALLRVLKGRLDPNGILAPGRFL